LFFKWFLIGFFVIALVPFYMGGFLLLFLWRLVWASCYHCIIVVVLHCGGAFLLHFLLLHRFLFAYCVA